MDDATGSPGQLDTDHVEVRTLEPGDLEWMVRLDRDLVGHPRHAYFELKLAEAQRDTAVRISLAASVGGTPAGFLMGRVYYGEFGLPEPAAILDTIVVGKDFRGQRVGKALLRQLRLNLRALRIEKIQTQVDWDRLGLIGFFQRQGFRPAPRLCLELALSEDD